MKNITTEKIFCSSDKNLKENIQQIPEVDPSIFQRIKEVKLSSFNFKDDKDKVRTYGTIAQDVQEAGFSELIYQNDDGYLAVDYTSLLILKTAYLENELILARALAMGILDESRKKHEELENKIKELESKIEELKK